LPHYFNKAFNKWLKYQNFKAAKANPSLYTCLSDNGDFIMLSVHVDNQLIAGSKWTALAKFKECLNAQFDFADSDLVGYRQNETFVPGDLYEDCLSFTAFLATQISSNSWTVG
jgi:hypothetical protein